MLFLTIKVCIKNIFFLICLSLEMLLYEPQIKATSHAIGSIYVFYIKAVRLCSNYIMW